MTLTKSVGGMVTLTGSSGFSGTTTISAGTLNIQNASALGSTAGAVNLNGGTLQMQGGIAVSDKVLNLGGGVLENVSGINSWAGAVTLNSSSTIAVDASTLTLSSGIGGTGGLTKAGGGTLILSASNGYGGSTTVSAGTLQLGNANALPSATALTLSGGTLDLNGNNNSVASLTMTNGSIGNSTGSGVLTVGSGNADLQVGTVSANLAGAMSLTKTTNVGTVVLSGSNGYSGSTTVSTGMLQLGNSALCPRPPP